MRFRSILLAACCCLLIPDVSAAAPSRGEWPSFLRKHKPVRAKKAAPAQNRKLRSRKPRKAVKPPAKTAPAGVAVPLPVPNPVAPTAGPGAKPPAGETNDRPATTAPHEPQATGPQPAPVPLPVPNPSAPPPPAPVEEKPPEPPATTPAATPEVAPAEPAPEPAEKKEPKPDAAAPVPLPVPNPIAPSAPAKVEEKTTVEPPTAGPQAPETPVVTAPPEAASDPVCDEIAAGGEIEFKPLPAITEGRCGAPFPISFTALTPKDGPRVTFETPVVTRCVVAKAALNWMRETVQPSAQKYLGEPIKALRSVNGYQCRGRNRVSGARLSEHGKANAIDIGGFQRTSGATIMVSEGDEPGLSFLLDIRAKACGPFKTVLGPGSDPYHATHFHFDSIERGKTKAATYCR